MSANYMLYAFILGRLIFGGYFVVYGLGHFVYFRRMRDRCAARRIPLPDVVVGGSGVLALFGGVSLAFGYLPRFGLLLLVIFLLGIAFQTYDFRVVPDREAQRNQWPGLARDIALLGAVMMMVAIPPPWKMSLGQIRQERAARVHGSAATSSVRPVSPPPAVSPAPSRADTSRK